MPLATVRAPVTGREQLVPMKKTMKNTPAVAIGDYSKRPWYKRILRYFSPPPTKYRTIMVAINAASASFFTGI